MGNSFKDLIVGQRSIQLTVSVYKLTAGFPGAERFGLTNQLRRASVLSQVILPKVMENPAKENIFSFSVTRAVRVRRSKLN